MDIKPIDFDALYRLAFDSARRLDSAAAGTPSDRPAADPFQAATLQNYRFDLTRAAIARGVVHDFISAVHAYRVCLGTGSFVWASPAGLGAGFGVWGARTTTTIPPGAYVRVLLDQDTPDRAVILGEEARPSVHRAFQPAETWWPIFRSGHSADVAHRAIADGLIAAAAKLPRPILGVDLVDLSAGRPLDSTSTGEWGVVTETGLGVGVDPFHTFIRVDEVSGLFGFYQDGLVRLAAGRNFQHWTPAENTEHLTDDGELRAVRKGWVFPWEGFGLWRWSQITAASVQTDPIAGQGFVNTDGFLVQKNADGYAIREPGDITKHFSRTEAARWWEYGGYLGQGGRRLLALPLQYAYYYPSANATRAAVATAEGVVGFYNAGSPTEPDKPTSADVVPPADRVLPEGDATIRFNTDPDYFGDRVPTSTVRTQPGVLDETRTLAGAYRLRTAKSIALVRRPAIPTPRERIRPEDPAGDGVHTGYPPNGNGPTAATIANTNRHKVYDELAYPLGAAQRVTAVIDSMAYAFNWETLHPFAYHFRDFYTPEEGDTGKAIVNQQVPVYSALKCAQLLADPTPIQMEVDHRYRNNGKANYYQNESGLVLHDDGSTSLYDGWGSERRTFNGMIEETAAGDIVIRAGRNIVLMAGHDVIIDAKDSVDVNASARDIRLSAWRNLHGLGGNSGCGGVLLESHADCTGYVFQGRAGESVDSSGIMLIARNSQIYGLAHDVVFKSPDNGRIILDAGTTGTIRQRAKYHHRIIEPNGTAVDFLLSSATTVGAANEWSLCRSIIGTTLYVHGNLGVRGTAYIPGLKIGQTGEPIPSGMLREQYLVTVYGPSTLAAKAAPAGANYIEYTARTDTQYLTNTAYTLWEARWQHMARLDNQNMVVWPKYEIVGSATATRGRAFPGTAWYRTTGFAKHEPMYVDTTAGWVAKKRMSSYGTPEAIYENAALYAPVYATPAYAYKVPVGSELTQTC